MEKISPKDLENLTSDMIDEIIQINKALAHGKRFRILTHLYKVKKASFNEIIQETELKRTAVANHLSQMSEAHLISNYKHGEYKITDTGEILFSGIINSFLETSIYGQYNAYKLKERYSVSSRDELTLNKKVVSHKAKYQPCWISLYGAVAGILQALGKKVDSIDVAGYTGYGFIVNVSKVTTCPSGPTALGGGWDIIFNNMKTLGYDVEVIVDNHSFPSKEDKATPEDVKRAKEFFLQVKEVIDRDDRPVAIWGIPTPEYGIVNGYEDDSYIVSTYRPFNEEPDDPIRYDKIRAPGCLQLIYFTNKTGEITEENDKAAIRLGIGMAKGQFGTLKNYQAGPEAYRVWAKQLGEGSIEDGSITPWGNSYIAVCYHENKMLQVQFLERLMEKYKDKPQADYFEKIANEYKKVENLLKEHTDTFGVLPPKKGVYTPEILEEASERLKRAIQPEKNAIEYLEKALAVWK